MADINITSLVDVTLTPADHLHADGALHPGRRGGQPARGGHPQRRWSRKGPVISITSNRQVFFQEQAVEMEDLAAAAGALRGGQGHGAGLPALRRGGALRIRAEGHGGGRTRRVPEPEPGDRPEPGRTGVRE